MKYVSMILALSSASLISAHSWGNPPRIGATLDYHEVMRSYDLPSRDIMDHYDALGVSALADWEYLRLGMSMSHNFGNMIKFEDGSEEKDPDYRIGYLHLSALFKYPFRLGQGSLALWPAVGMRGDYNLRFDYTGSGDGAVDPSPHDLTMIGGGGIDYAVSSQLALTATLLGAYSLTPSAADGADSVRVFGVSLGAGVLLTL